MQSLKAARNERRSRETVPIASESEQFVMDLLQQASKDALVPKSTQHTSKMEDVQMKVWVTWKQNMKLSI